MANEKMIEVTGSEIGTGDSITQRVPRDDPKHCGAPIGTYENLEKALERQNKRWERIHQLVTNHPDGPEYRVAGNEMFDHEYQG